MMPPDRKIVAESSAASAANAGPNQSKPHEEEGDDRGGEDFEEAFDPQVDHPPAPVFDDRQVRVLAPGQARAVEQADGAGGDSSKSHSSCCCSPGFLQGRTQHADHQEQPEQQADEQQRSARPGPDRHTRSPDGPSRTTRRRTACCGCSAIRRSASRPRRAAARRTAR